MAAPPSRRDQVRSASSPSVSCRISLSQSLANSANPSSAASASATVVLPAPGGPVTRTTCRSARPLSTSSDRGSPPPLRDAERLAHGPPDDLGVLAIGQCLVHGPAAERRQDMVLSDAVGVRVAELRPHPLPELRQPHARQANRTG